MAAAAAAKKRHRRQPSLIIAHRARGHHRGAYQRKHQRQRRRRYQQQPRIISVTSWQRRRLAAAALLAAASAAKRSAGAYHQAAASARCRLSIAAPCIARQACSYQQHLSAASSRRVTASWQLLSCIAAPSRSCYLCAGRWHLRHRGSISALAHQHRVTSSRVALASSGGGGSLAATARWRHQLATRHLIIAHNAPHRASRARAHAINIAAINARARRYINAAQHLAISRCAPRQRAALMAQRASAGNISAYQQRGRLKEGIINQASS